MMAGTKGGSTSLSPAFESETEEANGAGGGHVEGDGLASIAGGSSDILVAL